MRQTEQTAERAVPALRGWLNRLLDVAERMTHDIQYSEDDHLTFMALCFLSKQIDHARSVLVLIPSRDSVLVARSMIEGLGQLLWAATDADVLPLRWRLFAWVHDWRLLQQKVARGEIVDHERRIEIEEALREFGEQFLTGKAKRARDGGSAMPTDPYCENWRRGHRIREICETVGGKDLYDGLYAPFSDWHHWGVGGLGRALHREDNRVGYSSLSRSDSAATLATAFQCLLQTAEVLERRLSIGVSPKLSELKEGYIRWSRWSFRRTRARARRSRVACELSNNCFFMSLYVLRHARFMARMISEVPWNFIVRNGLEVSSQSRY
jgi:Family of unknown function (DUF5677)